MKSFAKCFKIFAIATACATASVLAAPLLPADACAQDTDKITIQFLGFGANPDYYAVLQSSRLSGKSLVIHQIGAQGPKLVYPLQKTSLEAALKSKEVAVYGIQANYAAGLTAPAGFQLGGMLFGENMQLTLSAGGQSMTLGYAPVFSNPQKTQVAQVSIVNAFWTQDSKRVVVILNQKLDGDWPVNTDVLAAFMLN